MIRRGRKVGGGGSGGWGGGGSDKCGRGGGGRRESGYTMGHHNPFSVSTVQQRQRMERKLSVDGGDIDWGGWWW